MGSLREYWCQLNGDNGHAVVVGDKDGTKQRNDVRRDWHLLVEFGQQDAQTSVTEQDENEKGVADARGH